MDIVFVGLAVWVQHALLNALKVVMDLIVHLTVTVMELVVIQ